MNKVVKILMERDGISEAEAKRLVDETASEIYEATYDNASVYDVDDIIMNNLGLEPDYLLDIIC